MDTKLLKEINELQKRLAELEQEARRQDAASDIDSGDISNAASCAGSGDVSNAASGVASGDVSNAVSGAISGIGSDMISGGTVVSQIADAPAGAVNTQSSEGFNHSSQQVPSSQQSSSQQPLFQPGSDQSVISSLGIENRVTSAPADSFNASAEFNHSYDEYLVLNGVAGYHDDTGNPNNAARSYNSVRHAKGLKRDASHKLQYDSRYDFNQPQGDSSQSQGDSSQSQGGFNQFQGGFSQSQGGFSQSQQRSQAPYKKPKKSGVLFKNRIHNGTMPTPRFSEENLGKYVLSILASILIFVAVAMFTGLFWDSLPYWGRFGLVELLGFVLAGLGLLRVKSQGSTNGFLTGLIGCGISVMYIGIISGTINWAIYNEIVMLALMILWFFAALYIAQYINSKLFSIIAYIGDMFVLYQVASSVSLYPTFQEDLVVGLTAIIMIALSELYIRNNFTKFSAWISTIFTLYTNLVLVLIMMNYDYSYNYISDSDPMLSVDLYRAVNVRFCIIPLAVIAFSVFGVYKLWKLEIWYKSNYLFKAFNLICNNLLVGAVFGAIDTNLPLQSFEEIIRASTQSFFVIVLMVGSNLAFSFGNWIQACRKVYYQMFTLGVMIAIISEGVVLSRTILPFTVSIALFALVTTQVSQNWDTRMKHYVARIALLEFDIAFFMFLENTYYNSELKIMFTILDYMLLIVVPVMHYIYLMSHDGLGAIKNRITQQMICVGLVAIPIIRVAYNLDWNAGITLFLMSGIVVAHRVVMMNPKSIGCPVFIGGGADIRGYNMGDFSSSDSSVYRGYTFAMVLYYISVIALSIATYISCSLSTFIGFFQRYDRVSDMFLAITLLIIAMSSIYFAVLSRNTARTICAVILCNYNMFVMCSLAGISKLLLMISVMGMVLSAVFIALGFVLHFKQLRLAGLLCIVFYVFKIIVFDVGLADNTLVNIGMLLLGGILCFVISWFYNKLNSIYGTDDGAPAGAGGLNAGADFAGGPQMGPGGPQMGPDGCIHDFGSPRDGGFAGDTQIGNSSQMDAGLQMGSKDNMQVNQQLGLDDPQVDVQQSDSVFDNVNLNK